MAKGKIRFSEEKTSEVINQETTEEKFITGWQGDKLVPSLPPKMTAEQGIQSLNQSFHEFTLAHKRWSEANPNRKQADVNLIPRMTIKGQAGLGKSRKVVGLKRELFNLVPTIATPYWADKRILVLVPTLALAKELAEHAENAGVNAFVVRGRNQDINEDERRIILGDKADDDVPSAGDEIYDSKKMCSRHELAGIITGAKGSVTNTLCHSKFKTKDGQTVEEFCPFYNHCPYIQQAKSKNVGLVIAPHAYLNVKSDLFKDEDFDLLIIDESFWQNLQGHAVLTYEDIETLRTLPVFAPKEDGISFEETQLEYQITNNKMVSLFNRLIDENRDRLTVQDFEDAGITADIAKSQINLEYSRIQTPEIHAGMPFKEMKEKLKKAIPDKVYSYAKMWTNISKELRIEGRHNIMSITREVNKTVYNFKEKRNEQHDCLVFHYVKTPSIFKVPTLMIDADANQSINDIFFPSDNSVFKNIDINWKNTRIVQVYDKSASKNLYLGDDLSRAQNRRNDLFKGMVSYATRKGFVWGDERNNAEHSDNLPLLVSYKKIIKDIWQGPDEDADPDELGHVDFETAEDRNFKMEWFGNLRGNDRYKHTKALVVAGRLQPSTDVLEDTARAIFGLDGAEMQFLPRIWNEETGRFQAEGMPTENRPIRGKNGSYVMVPVQYHPDSRINIILEQIRESEISQVISRVRPVHRADENPCEVVILSNVPVPGVEVDEFITYKNWFAMDDVNHFTKDGIWFKNDKDEASAFPQTFPSANAIAQLRSSHGNRITPRHNWMNATIKALKGKVFEGKYYPGGARQSRKVYFWALDAEQHSKRVQQIEKMTGDKLTSVQLFEEEMDIPKVNNKLFFGDVPFFVSSGDTIEEVIFEDKKVISIFQEEEKEIERKQVMSNEETMNIVDLYMEFMVSDEVPEWFETDRIPELLKKDIQVSGNKDCYENRVNNRNILERKIRYTNYLRKKMTAHKMVA